MSEYFFERMRELLGSEYIDFKHAYDSKPRHKALRINTVKIGVDDFMQLTDAAKKQNPLCDRSFYTDVKPSLDPLYHAGLYYMQEPSASAAVAAFAPFIGERVLDLCSAPGGKGTQAAAFMRGGTIFMNDVETSRLNALRENAERLGITNAVITRATAADYVRGGAAEFFDTVMIDAPCSGGGMMRYEKVPYSAEIVDGCAKRQREILDGAAELLCKGGRLLYSTCTFSREENEDNVGYLISKGFSTVAVPLRDGETRGIDLPDARRIYPHRFDGEGHFYCVLEKTVGGKNDLPYIKCKRVKRSVGGAVIDCTEYRSATLPIEIPQIDVETSERGIRVSPVGTFGSGKVGGKKIPTTEFTHGLTHGLTAEQARAVGAVELDAENANKYIRGEQLDVDAPDGLRIATYKGYALGWVKSAKTGAGERALKNLYPRRLRV